MDDDELERIGAEIGVNAAPADALATAVRETLRSGDAMFVGHLVKRTEWRREGISGPPPYIGLLALCVLAASRMARDPEKGIEGNAYYPQLNPLIGRSAFAGAPPGFEQVGDLWRDLCQWLDDDRQAKSGRSTASTHPFFVHIGWPISQCLLREGDRRRLTLFFRSVGLEPKTDIETSRLWTLFANWVHDGCGLSDQAIRIVRHAKQEVVDQIAEIIRREFDVWQGEVLDAQGRRRGEIALVLEIAAGGRRVASRLVPRHPEGFPTDGLWRLQGNEFPLRVAGEEWYEQLDVRPNPAILTDGLTMTSGAFALVYDAAPAVPLRASLGLGAWASVHQATAFEEHCIVIQEAHVPVLRSFLERYAERGWRLAESAGNLPHGWHVVTGVRLMRPVAEAPEGLHRLAPRLHTATRLDGGLRVAPRQYLTSGEPDLWITVDQGQSAVVELDERRIEVSDGVLELKLAKLDPVLEEGEHEIMAGGIRRRFTTLSGFPAVATSGTGSLAHVLARHGTYRPVGVEAEPIPSDDPPRGTVYVCGASARALAEDLPEPQQPPVLIPAGFATYTILGSLPGEVLTLLPPSYPHWLRELGLGAQLQFFDQPVPFTAEWLIAGGRLGVQVRPLRDRPADPNANGKRLADGPAEAWREAIRDAVRSGARPTRCADVWNLYVEAAA